MADKTDKNTKRVDLPDGRTFDVYPDDTSEVQLQKALHELCDDGQRFGVEFECGECCKKVINAAHIIPLQHHLILVPDHKDFLLLKAFSGGKLVEKQIMHAIIIPWKRVCSVEIQPLEIDP